MRNKIILLSIFILLFAAVSFAETTIKAEVDKKSMTTDEMLTYKIIIHSSDQKIAQPEVPKFDDFSIVSQVRSTSAQFLKASVTNTHILAFVLSPLKSGELEIKPASLKVGNNVLSATAFKIDVVEGKIKPEEKFSLPEGAYPDSEQTTL